MSSLVSNSASAVKMAAGTPSSTPSAAAASAAGAQGSASTPGYHLPDSVTLRSAAKWAIIEDKPIMMDYWADSLEKKVVVGVKQNGEKLLVKSADEYTSPIVNIFKNKTDLIIMTENSIYVVDAGVDVVKIT